MQTRNGTDVYWGVTMGENKLDDVYGALRVVMLRHADSLVVATDSATQLSIEASEPEENGKTFWYGGVHLKKNYVSYHLMPVYENPALLDDISPRLRARMQGKACFNFKTIDDELFAQLDVLTGVGFRDFTEHK